MLDTVAPGGRSPARRGPEGVPPRRARATAAGQIRSPDRSRRRGLAHALARLLRLMHDRSLSHRDVKAANLLREGDDEDGPAIRLIDLVGVELRHPLPMDRRLQNLARVQLSVARSGLLGGPAAWRFLGDYGGALVRDPLARKSLWKAVAARASQKRRKNRRSGRELT